MREITYICNKCGKTIEPRCVTKINLTIQKGSNPVEKKSYDFCSPCYLYVKSAFENSLKADGDSGNKKTPKAQEPAQEPSTSNTKSADDKPITVERSSAGDSIILGPLNAKEKKEILRLYVEEELLPEDIATKMNRLPRGIKRTINAAEKSGELDKLRADLQKRKETPAAEVVEEEESSRDHGSGVSNAGIMKDSYTAPPQTEVIYGKRYDVGGILALAKVGWPSDKIAEERHYDEAVVRVIMEKYM